MNLPTAKTLFSVAAVGMISLSQAHASPATNLASTYLWNGGESYAAYSLSNFLGASSVLNGSSILGGDFGVGPGANTLNSDASSTFGGNIYVAPGSLLTGTQTFSGVNAGPPSQPSGPHQVFAGSSVQMSSQSSTLYNGSSNLAGLATATNYTSSNSRLFVAGSKNLSFSGNSTNLTLNSAAGSNVQSVLNLTNFSIASASSATPATLTLNGNSTDSFVFNISGLFLLSKAQINLTGGLLAQNVIFNITGASPASEGEGTAAYYSLLGSTVNGNIIATQRTISLTQGSVLNGSAIGERVVVDNSTINQTPSSP